VVAGLIAAVKLARVESRNTEQESSGSFCNIGFDYDCPHGGGG
jgi:hypothetical protein